MISNSPAKMTQPRPLRSRSIGVVVMAASPFDPGWFPEMLDGRADRLLRGASC
jgi:hypothetical protein